MRFFFLQSLHICAKCSIFAADFVIFIAFIYPKNVILKGFCASICVI